MRAKVANRLAAAPLTASAVLGLSITMLLTNGCARRTQTAPAPAAAVRAAPAPGDAIRAGIAPDFPPLAFKEDGQLQGIEPDFAQKLSQQGVNVTLTPMAWTELIPALQNGRIDVIMSGMSITAQRIKLVDFTVPYLRAGQMALVRTADYNRLRDPKAMEAPKARVGFVGGTTSEKHARDQLPTATLVSFATTEDGVAALRGNKIDYFLNDATVVWKLTSRQAHNDDLAGIYRPLTREYIAWAVRRGPDGDTLRERLNEALLGWQEDGQLEAVLDHWIPVRKVTVETR